MPLSRPSVAIIGAGISGLSCARALAASGIGVVVLEKSRSLGGRCATRKWEGHVVDSGAQYFTIRDRDFRAELDALCGGDLRVIDAPFLDAADAPISAASPRWYHREGNNRLGRALRGDLPVRMETTVTELETAGDGWLIGGERFDAVVSSAPWPQTAALLGRGDSAGFVPCLTAFFGYAGDWAGNSSRAYARLDAAAELAWSACENHKAGRVQPGETVFVAQASPEFSATYLEAEPAEWAARLQAAVEARWELAATSRRATFTHRWRYARRTGEIVSGQLPAGFFLAGDGRTDSRVEAAWLSGRLAAGEVRTYLQ